MPRGGNTPREQRLSRLIAQRERAEGRIEAIEHDYGPRIAKLIDARRLKSERHHHIVNITTMEIRNILKELTPSEIQFVRRTWPMLRERP